MKTTRKKGMKKNTNKKDLADDTGAKDRESLLLIDGVDFGAAKNNGTSHSLGWRSHHGRRESNQMPVQNERNNKNIKSSAKRRGSDFDAVKNNGRGQSQECTKSSRKRPSRRPSLLGHLKSNQRPRQMEGRDETEESRDLGESESDDFWNDAKEPRDTGQSERCSLNNLVVQGASHACLRCDLGQRYEPVDTKYVLHETKRREDLVLSKCDDFWA